MARITASDLDVVNRAVWRVRTKMSELAKMYGTPETAFMARTSDPTGLFWMGEVRNLVINDLKSRLSVLNDAWQKNPMGYLSQWFEMYRLVVTWTIFGALCRESAMSVPSGESGSYYWSEKALAYEMSVLDHFSRWSDIAHLGEMSNVSVLTEPPVLEV